MDAVLFQRSVNEVMRLSSQFRIFLNVFRFTECTAASITLFQQILPVNKALIRMCMIECDDIRQRAASA